MLITHLQNHKVLPAHQLISHLHSACKRRSHCRRCCHRCHCFPPERCFLKHREWNEAFGWKLLYDSCLRKANTLHIILELHTLFFCCVAKLKVGYTAHRPTKPLVLLSSVFPSSFSYLVSSSVLLLQLPAVHFCEYKNKTTAEKKKINSSDNWLCFSNKLHFCM